MVKFASIRDPERRRCPRFPWELDVVLVLSERGHACRTVDVSLYGVYVGTDEPLEPNRVVQVRVSQGLDDPIEWVGVAKRVVSRSEATDKLPPGMAIEIFAIDDAHWARWTWLVASVAERCEAEYGPRQTRAKGPSASETPRRHARYQTPVQVRLGSMPALIRFAARDISAGGIFIKPAPPVSLGDQVTLNLTHPLSKAAFDLAGRVVRLEEKGVAIEFIDLTEEIRDRLKRFIVTGVKPA